MNKKILIISVIILALTVALTACKGKTEKEPDDTTSNTDIVVATVPVTNEEGTTIDVTIYQDSKGEQYVTNYQGDKIPMTTDASGFKDDPGYLITQTTVAPSSVLTTAPNNNNNSSTTTTAPAGNNGSTTTTTAPAVSDPTTSTTSAPSNTTTTGGGIEIGTGAGHQDSIPWDKLKNPQN